MEIKTSICNNDLQLAKMVFQQGGIVAFPTETSYGLAVDPFKQQALEGLFVLKERPKEKPVLVVINHLDQLNLLVNEIPDIFKPLMERYWPGPLTLIFPATSGLPSLLTGETKTVGVRLTSHPLAAQFIDAVGGPVTATSANLSGITPCVRAEEVRSSFKVGLDFVLDGGPTTGGPASTILACFGDVVWLVRDGAVPFREVQEILAAAAE